MHYNDLKKNSNINLNIYSENFIGQKTQVLVFSGIPIIHGGALMYYDVSNYKVKYVDMYKFF